jgi:hypothetical protein
VIGPTTDDVLGAVVDAVEREIAPACAEDPYAVSLCRTVSQMLRSVRIRVRAEPAALVADNAELRALLAGVPVQVAPAPEPTLPPLDALQEEARELRAALAAAIAAQPDEGHPVRKQAREYLARHLEREAEWQQDAYTGPRR